MEELLTHRHTNDVRQSVWTVRRTFALGDHRIRATVHEDPYQFQCDYYVELLDPTRLQWHRVHTETNDWHRGIGALSIAHLKPEQWEMIDTMIDHMVQVAAELLPVSQ